MKDNSFPAFPCDMPGEPHGKDGPTRHYFPGMSLRDYFAAKALQGFWSQPGDALPLNKPYEQNRDELCRLFYEWADAVIVARSNKGGERQ